MPDISKIQLPGSNNVQNIKDATARQAIANIHTFDYTVCTNAADTPYGVQWSSGGTTITGTLAAASGTMYKIYLVPQDNDTGDYYDEYITVNPSGSTYSWEKFGSTQIDLSTLGALAYKDSASGSFTPNGSVSQPTFSGSSMTSTGSFTPSGSVTVSTDTTANQTATVAPVDSGEATYTPAGSVGAPTISISSAGSTDTVYSITDVGTLPALTTSVADETLTISFSQGTLPTKGSAQTVKTGDASYTATAPSFSGTGVRLVTGNITVPSTYTASFSGTAGSVSVSGTPEGTVSQPSFNGTAGTVTVS